jgi:hypothetical protein
MEARRAEVWTHCDVLTWSERRKLIGLVNVRYRRSSLVNQMGDIHTNRQRRIQELRDVIPKWDKR